MDISDLDVLCYIQEQTSFESDYKNFGYQIYPKDANTSRDRFYLIFDAVLQSFGVMNRNGREYDLNNVWERIQKDDYIQSMLRQNSWMGEIDHPAPEFKDQELSANRVANPDLKKTSHYIRRPRINRNLLEATIQTDSSNEHGMNMAIKIVDGKIIPCFSARLLGALRKIMNRPIVYVNKLICYDWVLYPSHREAVGKINQTIQESADILSEYAGAKIIFFKDLAQMVANDLKETELLCESFGLTINDVIGLTNTGNSLVIKENNNLYMQPITDKFIRMKTQKHVRDWLNS